MNTMTTTAATMPAETRKEKDRKIFNAKIDKAGETGRKLAEVCIEVAQLPAESRVVPSGILKQDHKQDPLITVAHLRTMARDFEKQVRRLKAAACQKSPMIPGSGALSSFTKPTMYSANMMQLFLNVREEFGTFDIDHLNRVRSEMVNTHLAKIGRSDARFPVDSVQAPTPGVTSGYILDQIMLTAGFEIDGAVHRNISCSTVVTLLGTIYTSRMGLGRFAKPPVDVANKLKANYLRNLTLDTESYKIANAKHRFQQKVQAGTSKVPRTNLPVVPKDHLEQSVVDSILNDQSNGYGVWASASYVGPDQNMIDTLHPETFEALGAKCAQSAAEKAANAAPLLAGRKASNKMTFTSTGEFFTRVDFQVISSSHTLPMESIVRELGERNAERYFGSAKTDENMYLRSVLVKEILFLSAVSQAARYERTGIIPDFIKKVIEANLGKTIDEKWVF